MVEKDLLSRLNKEVILKAIPLLCDGRSKHSACQFASLLRHQADGANSAIPVALDTAWPLIVQRLNATSPKAALAFLISRLLLTGPLTLAKVAETLTAGRHFPLFLLILQHLARVATSAAMPGDFLITEQVDVAKDGDFIPEGVDLPSGVEGRRTHLVAMFASSGVVLEKMLPGEDYGLLNVKKATFMCFNLLFFSPQRVANHQSGCWRYFKNTKLSSSCRIYALWWRRSAPSSWTRPQILAFSPQIYPV